MSKVTNEVTSYKETVENRIKDKTQLDTAKGGYLSLDIGDSVKVKVLDINVVANDKLKTEDKKGLLARVELISIPEDAEGLKKAIAEKRLGRIKDPAEKRKLRNQYVKEVKLTPGQKYDVWVTDTMYASMKLQLEKSGIVIDDDLKCLIDKKFEVAAKSMVKDGKGQKAFVVELLEDEEVPVAEKEIADLSML